MYMYVNSYMYDRRKSLFSVIILGFFRTIRLRDFSEWGQCQVLKLLERYHPASEDEIFDMLVSQ